MMTGRDDDDGVYGNQTNQIIIISKKDNSKYAKKTT